MRRGGSPGAQTLVGVALLAIGVAIAVGAIDIPSNAGYAGVGPNFLPWLVASWLFILGIGVVWEARTGGYRHMDEPSGSARGYWPGFAWMSAGLLANAALITSIGFILSCSLCFTLAVRGLRAADRQGGSNPAEVVAAGAWAQTLRDACIGVAIAAPVYWMFTKLLAINLPGLSASGWI